MFIFSEWAEQDGVHECIVSFFYAAVAQPIIRCRAVKTEKGAYEAVLREYTGRGAEIERGPQRKHLAVAKAEAMNRARNYLIDKSRELSVQDESAPK